MALEAAVSIEDEGLLDGVEVEFDGAVPFVRIGRAVVMFLPPASFDTSNTFGYPDSQLDRALATTVAKLRAAQGA